MLNWLQFDLRPLRQMASPRLIIHKNFTQRRSIRTIIFSAAVLTGAATFAATLIAPRAAAQDLGEIARQERAKKENKPAPATTHVYTNDDVKRPEILTPEDKSRYSAAHQSEVTKPAQTTAQSTTPQSPALPTPQPSAPTKVSSADAPNAKTIPTADVVAVPNVTSVPTAIPASTAIPVAVSSSVTTTQPVVAAEPSVPLDQMPLGDVARYYRAKKQQEDAASAKVSPPTSVVPSSVASSHASPSRRSYPLPVATPLAAMKSPSAPAAPRRLDRSPSVPTTSPTLTRPVLVKPSPSRPTLARPSYVPRRLYLPLPSNGSVRVAAGDTLWRLARRYLGTGTRWTELIALNPSIQNPRRLRVGAQLVLHPPTI